MNTEQILTIINTEYELQSSLKDLADFKGRSSSSLMHAYAMGVLTRLKDKIKLNHGTITKS